MADLSKLKKIAESGVQVAQDEETRVEYVSGLNLQRAKDFLTEDTARAAAKGKPRQRMLVMQTGLF